MLRLTPLLTLLAFPLLLTRLVNFHKRVRPPLSLLDPALDAVVLSCFPIAWFFGFMYYTDLPSLAFVIGTVVLARQERHWASAFVSVRCNRT
jgi:alpha-1,2-glucosyltransferase